ncbi:sensitivity to high expression protein she9 [Microbotryomycetes sp. JL201]|nr:sensitivity to high expression protein she9 [Microbotryomycetes sp. JL201]
MRQHIQAATSSYKTHLKRAVDQLELERKLRDMGGKINQATGYEDIERLRLGVKQLLEARELASSAKRAYSAAVATRSESQKEVNDLLQRKSTWTSADVIRFTELIQRDHENERAEARAKVEMETSEHQVEKCFSALMQSILQRYHEEQVWSDKIRSMSTYGSLGITGLNVLLFIVTILLVEPWKRRRLVEGVEERLRTRTSEGQDATMASLLNLQSLLTDAQSKLDTLVDTERNTEEVESAAAAAPAEVAIPPPTMPLSQDGSRSLEIGQVWANRHMTKEQELAAVGGVGVLAGVVCTLLVRLLFAS